MKSLFMVFILFLHSNGKLEVVRTVDKCNSWSAAASAKWLSDPKHWNSTLTPLEGFFVEKRVTEKEWETHCYSQNPIELTWYDHGKQLLLLHTPVSP